MVTRPYGHTPMNENGRIIIRPYDENFYTKQKEKQALIPLCHPNPTEPTRKTSKNLTVTKTLAGRCRSQ